MNMNIGYVVTKFADDPIPFALSIGIFIISLAFFIKIAGNPVSYLTNLLKNLAPFALKELRGKSGKAGVINMTIVVCVGFLAFVVLLKPSITGLFQDKSVNSYVFSLVIFLVTIVTFLISLKLVSDNEKFSKLCSKTK